MRTGGDAYTQYFYYDASGNRTKKTLGGTDTVYVYNTSDQLTLETTGGVTTTYEYDENGALTKSDDGTTVNAYTYDYEGYLATFDTTGTDNDATYTYDADKRRIAKVVDSVTTKYFLDGANVIADYDVSDVLQATYLTPGLDANLSQTRSGSTYYYMRDGLGSIRNLVESDEDTANTYDYYAFGKELGSWTEGVTNRYTYTAREWDAESAQYYYRARYYDGGGRFSGRDHTGAFGYTYCSNSPCTLVDPSGNTSACPLCQGTLDLTALSVKEFVEYQGEKWGSAPKSDQYFKQMVNLSINDIAPDTQLVQNAWNDGAAKMGAYWRAWWFKGCGCGNYIVQVVKGTYVLTVDGNSTENPQGMNFILAEGFATDETGRSQTPDVNRQKMGVKSPSDGTFAKLEATIKYRTCCGYYDTPSTLSAKHTIFEKSNADPSKAHCVGAENTRTEVFTVDSDGKISYQLTEGGS